MRNLYGECTIEKDTYIHPQNRQEYTLYTLTKHETMVLVTGFNIKARAKIIERWQELEQKIAQQTAGLVPDFSDPAAMAEAWAAQYRASIAAQADVARLESVAAANAPLVDFAVAVAADDGLVCMGTLAKMLGTGQNRLFAFLVERGVLFARDGYKVPYQQHIDAGRFRVIESVYKIGNVERIGLKTMATGKGQIYVSGLVDKHKDGPLPM